MAELQCPNCGGYKTGAKSMLVNLLALLLVLCLPLIGFVFAFFVVSRGLADFLSFGKSFSLWAVRWAVIIAVPVFLFLSMKYVATRCNDYSCRICGYQWDKRNVSAGTQVRVKQDLIEKGNILLEQAEEHRRQRQRHG